MAVTKEIKPFIYHLLWVFIKGCGGAVLCLAALFWAAGWIAMIPLMAIGAWIDGDMHWVWVVAVELFYWVPAAAWAFVALNESWENYLLKKGYTKI